MNNFEISLSGLRFHSFHGVFEQERKIGNDFYVTVKILVPYDEETWKDDVEMTVSYADIYEIIKSEMNIPRKLLETVALSIKKRIISRWDNIEGGRITISKSHPPIEGIDAGNASISISF